MTRHIGAEDLARYREGDLGSRKSARVRAHLAGCPRCTALQADLARGHRAAGQRPSPGHARPGHGQDPGRAHGRGGQHGGGQHGGGREHGPDGNAGAGRRARRAWPAPPLAARRRSGRRRAPLAAARAQVSARGPRARRRDRGRRDRRRRIRGSASLAAAGQTGAGSSSAGSIAAPAPRTPSRLSGPALHYRPGRARGQYHAGFDRDGLRPGSDSASQAAGALRRSTFNLPATAGPDTSSGHGTQHAPGTGGHAPRSFAGLPVSALQGCLTRISAGRTVLLVDVDGYQGKPATIIVVAGGAGGTSGSRVFVVGPGCSASNSDLVTEASLPSTG